MAIKRTISGMVGAGSLAHNRRDFIAENVAQDRVSLNICYCDENIKAIYSQLFDEAVERYNIGKRKDRKITNYYEKIRQGKQEKLFHEVIFQIGNCEDMAVGTPEGNLAVKVLDQYMQDFQRRNPNLRVFSCYLHQDEATPHLHIDFVPYVTGWKGKGMDTRVSLKQALKSQGFQGGTKHATELNQWINHEKEVLAEMAKQHGIEWEQKGTTEEHLDVYNFKKKERKKEVQELEQEKEYLTAEKELENLAKQRAQLQPIIDKVSRELKECRKIVLELPEAGTLERASTYRDKKIAPLFNQMKGIIAGLAAQIQELNTEIEKWKEKYKREKQICEAVKKDLSKALQRNQYLQEEKEDLLNISERYSRVVRVLGNNTVKEAIQKDIQREMEIEENRRKEQSSGKSILELLKQEKRKSMMENQYQRPGKKKYRGMEI